MRLRRGSNIFCCCNRYHLAVTATEKRGRSAASPREGISLTTDVELDTLKLSLVIDLVRRVLSRVGRDITVDADDELFHDVIEDEDAVSSLLGGAILCFEEVLFIAIDGNVFGGVLWIEGLVEILLEPDHCSKL